MTDFRNNPKITVRGLRNNNPGNIIRSGIAWKGKVVGTDSRFETFDSVENGLRAVALNLMTYFATGTKTPAAIAKRWSPDGNEIVYGEAIAKTLGIGPNTEIKPTKQNWEKLLRAITNVENGTQAAIVTAAMISTAVNLASQARTNFFIVASAGGALVLITLAALLIFKS
jgi:hypothetical protein